MLVKVLLREVHYNIISGHLDICVLEDGSMKPQGY